MNRRFFLLSLASMFITTNSFAEAILKGPSAKASGERSRTVWEYANMLKGLRLAKAEEHVQMIVFFDPNCPSCEKLWQWSNVHAPNIASLWIPVAYVNKSSINKAALLLRATNPRLALQDNYQSSNSSSHSGMKSEKQLATEEEKAAIRNNSRFWSKTLFGTTPLMLYRKNDGTYWQELGFSPDRMEALLSVLATP